MLWLVGGEGSVRETNRHEELEKGIIISAVKEKSYSKSGRMPARDWAADGCDATCFKMSGGWEASFRPFMCLATVTETEYADLHFFVNRWTMSIAQGGRERGKVWNAEADWQSSLRAK